MSLFGLLPQGLGQTIASAMGSPNPMQQTQPLLAPDPRPEHKGVFGVKGTFRDVLGVLGDAFLMNQGIAPMYREQRQGEKLSDAMLGFEEDPVAGIGRISAIDKGLGQKYYGDYLQSKDRGAKLEYDKSKDRLAGEGAFNSRLGGLFGAANEKTYPAMLANARKLAESRGYGHLLEGLPETWDEGAVKGWVRSTMEPKEQANVDYRNRRADQFDADRGERIRHNRATEGTARTNAATSQGRAAKKTKVDGYTGEDGYRYTVWSDGSETKSKTKVQPTGKGTRAPAPNIPPPPPGFKTK